MRYTAPLRSNESSSRLRSQSRAQLRARRAGALAVDGGQCCLLHVNISRWRPIGKVRSGSWGGGGTSVLAWRKDVQQCYVLDTRYLTLASRVGNHFRTPVPASLQPAIRRTVQQAKQCCVCAVVKCPVISLPYMTI